MFAEVYRCAGCAYKLQLGVVLPLLRSAQNLHNPMTHFISLETTGLLAMTLHTIKLVQGGESAFHLPSVIAVSIAFGVKLALFLYCFALQNKYPQIRILWEDHRNDLFINGFGILTSVGGAKLTWWIDLVGATVVSLLILVL